MLYQQYPHGPPMYKFSDTVYFRMYVNPEDKNDRYFLPIGCLNTDQIVLNNCIVSPSTNFEYASILMCDVGNIKIVKNGEGIWEMMFERNERTGKYQTRLFNSNN